MVRLCRMAFVFGFVDIVIMLLNIPGASPACKRVSDAEQISSQAQNLMLHCLVQGPEF